MALALTVQAGYLVDNTQKCTIISGRMLITDTGNYPGKEEITDGLTLINKPLTDKESPKFIDRFNTLLPAFMDERRRIQARRVRPDMTAQQRQAINVGVRDRQA